MLILGRRPGESILIAGNIRLVVISCDKRGVRLGIEAPPEVVIVRGELVTPLPGPDAGALAAVGPVRQAEPAARTAPPAAGPRCRTAGTEDPAAPDATIPATASDDGG
jgi:carbon storage regulator